MKITFENAQDSIVQNQGNAGRIPHEAAQDTLRKAEKTATFSVNIGKERSAREGTYKKEDMSAEKVSMMAGSMDMDVQKMYMAVMSNSMSPEEFGDMLEDGYQVSDMDIETVVTILDRIKVAVAKGGGEISGFTDNLSKETLEQILGSSSYAEAISSGLEEGAVAYMVKQQMEPTAENLYKAKYSGGNYSGQKDMEMPEMDEKESAAFQAQIDKVILEAGLEINDENREDAAFLLKHEIPLTKENLRMYEKCKPFVKGQESLSEQELKDRIAMQIYEGREPAQADLSRDRTIYEVAAELYDAVRELTPEAADRAVRERPAGEKTALRDLIRSQKELEKEAFQDTGERAKKNDDNVINTAELPQDKTILAARRQLEEVRLKMTVEANVKLLRSGFQIDTAPMEELIERLKAAEQTLMDEGTLQAADAVEKLAELQKMPAAVLSYAVSGEISFTIGELHEKGKSLQPDYDRAKERYETMQTAPRSDLGDSIRKAFRNVDDILADMNREPSEENRRAVRILGYHQLEITQENLERALSMDRKVQNLFQDMKPGKVLQMIRDGVDVLHTDVEELDAYLTIQKSEFLEESGDFARFLHKLDRNGEITPQERENYIGIYRLIRQVEKSDGKAEGYLLGSGAEVTLENLLAAVRSDRKGNMDYRIEEDFSGLDAVQKGKNILEQLSAVSGNSSEAERKAYYEETIQVLKEAGRYGQPGENNAVDFLKEMKQPVTVSNLLAASSVLQEDAGIYQKIEDYEKAEKQEENLEMEQSRLEGYVMKLEETMTGEASLQEGMEVFEKEAEALLREAETREGITELDIRDMQQLYKGIRFRTALSRESRYQIPVKLEEGYTVMNLTIRHGEGRAQAEISIETESHGRLEALFAENTAIGEKDVSIRTTGISGSLFAETQAGEKLLRDIAGKVKEFMSEAGISIEDMKVMRGSRMHRQTYEPLLAGKQRIKETAAKNTDTSSKVSTGELYQIAKIFLETVRNEC